MNLVLINVEYKQSDGEWTSYTNGEIINLANTGDTVSFRGTDVVTNYNKHFYMTGQFAASGDVTSLTNRSGLNAILTDSCYSYIFYGCTGLTAAPSLPATELAVCCYMSMFEGCTALKISYTKTESYNKAWRIPTTGTITLSDFSTLDMLFGTGGTFTGDPSLNTTYYVYDSTPSAISGIKDGKTIA